MSSREAEAGPRRGAGREQAIRAGLVVLGGGALLTSVAMVVDPAGFIEGVGGFGAVNEHLVRDVATWTAAYALALLVAIRIRGWRVPVLAIGVAQGALHVVNHVADAGLAVPGWKGAASVAAFAGLMLLTLGLLVAARRHDGAVTPSVGRSATPTWRSRLSDREAGPE